MKTIPFTKAHGIGNDFILLNMADVKQQDVTLDIDFIQRICNRNFGIGSDGLLIADQSDIADIKYVMYNPDGSIAEMCGNGIRCFMKYILDHDLVGTKKVSVETGAGMLHLSLENDLVVVDMGSPKLDNASIGIIQQSKTIESAGQEFDFYPVSMGNPHAVIVLDSPVADFDLNRYGAPIEANTAYFKSKINVEFINIVSDTEIDFRVYERGAGETLACGTGACASVVAGIQQGLLTAGEDVIVHLKGGDLTISWSGKLDESVIMKGPAQNSFTGEYII